MKVMFELTGNGWLVSMEHPVLGKKSLGPGTVRPQSFVDACEMARRLIHYAADTTVADIHAIQDLVDRKPSAENEQNENLIRGPWARPREEAAEESEA